MKVQTSAVKVTGRSPFGASPDFRNVRGWLALTYLPGHREWPLFSAYETTGVDVKRSDPTQSTEATSGRVAGQAGAFAT
jgi:hypothetical protein